MNILPNEALNLIESEAPLSDLMIKYLQLVANELEPVEIMATLGMDKNDINRLDRAIREEFDI